MHAKGREKKRTAGSLRQVDVDEVLRICASSTKAGPSQGLLAVEGNRNDSRSRNLWVFNRQHNGFGNQVFQYIFSRLLAESTGRLWRTSLLEPTLGEAPWRKLDRPPNSESGWLLLRNLFPSADDATSATGRGLDMGIVRANPDMNASLSSCLEPERRCVISDRPYDQHLSKQPLLSQMITAFYSPECEAKCLFLIGYYQEPLFFLPFRARVMQWLGAVEYPRTRFQYPRLGENDIAVHVRCCHHSGGGCDWLFLPFEFYDAVLSRLVAHKSNARVFVVAPCRTDCPMIESFQRKYNATHVTPGKERHRHQKDEMVAAMASDFRFLMQARTVVLGKSTFGFWAGFLSRNAIEIHIPVESRRHHYEKVPLVQDDARFVFHNPGLDLWFGQPQGGESVVRYEERGRWFGPKTLDENGNYIMTKAS